MNNCIKMAESKDAYESSDNLIKENSCIKCSETSVLEHNRDSDKSSLETSHGNLENLFKKYFVPFKNDVEMQLDDVKTQLGDVKTQLGDVKTQLNELSDTCTDLNKRVERLESNELIMADKIDSILNEKNKETKVILLNVPESAKITETDDLKKLLELQSSKVIKLDLVEDQSVKPLDKVNTDNELNECHDEKHEKNTETPIKTIGEMPKNPLSDDGSNLKPFGDTQNSWTDDLPVCKESGVGFSTNQIYREDGCRQEDHPFEDRCFHCKYDESTFLYGVFDGHEGSRAVNFALQRMAAEILLGQLNGKSTDEEVKEVLRQAFISVERGYFDSIGDLLAERTSLQCDLPEGLNSYEAYQKFPDVVGKLNELNRELSAGTSAAVALVYRNRLYVANVGDSRALLCKTDSNQVLRVIQLSIDHNLRNEDELLRLSQLGLDIKSIRQGSHLGNQENTRCLGNFLVKGGYREFEELAASTAEPIIAEPEIHGGIELDESCRFLLLMSRGLYQSLEEATGTDQVNKELALMAVEQFRIQSTITGVAQAVVDKIVRIHHDMNMSNTETSSAKGKREDITLLVRNFNFPIPHALKSPTNQSVRFNPIVQTAIANVQEGNDYPSTSIATTVDNFNPSSNETSSTSETSTSGPRPDRNARIKPYVDFSEFFANVEKRRKAGTLPKNIDFGL